MKSIAKLFLYPQEMISYLRDSRKEIKKYEQKKNENSIV